MLQCKIFSGKDAADVEQQVNRFLNDRAKVLIHSILQSSDQTRMYVSIFFNVRTRAAKMKEASIAEVSIPITQSELPAN